jgi:hypothetical protein
VPSVQGHDLGLLFQLLVAGEHVAGAAVFQRAVHLELARRAARRLLLFHRGVEAGLVHRHAALAADVLRQVEREAVGVVQLEGDVAGQHLLAAGQRRVQDLHAVGERLVEALFLRLQHVHHALLGGLQVRIGLAHQLDQVGHQLVEERRLLAQLVAVADGAADDAALHVAAAFVRRDHAVGHQEGGGADVVGDDAQRRVGQVLGCRVSRPAAAISVSKMSIS